MKRILLVSPFPPYIGGVSISVQRLYEHLRYSGYEAVRFNTQIENKKYNWKILKFFKYLFLPVYLLSRKRFDVIHFHVSHIIPKLYVALWRPLFPGTRFVITIHGQIRNLFRKKSGHFALSRFDKIIIVTKGDSVRVPFDLRKKTIEIPAFIPPVMSERNSYFMPDGLEDFLRRSSFKILLNGVITINENYHDLYGFKDAILLLENLRKSRKNADLILIVIGSDYNRTSRDYLESLKHYVRVKDLESNVFWIEGVSMELWPLLKKVNVLLRPTKSDGDALSIRESLYLNIPVISSDVVPRPEGTLVYNFRSDSDLLNKTLSLIEHYDDHVISVSKTGSNINFAEKIIEQYET